LLFEVPQQDAKSAASELKQRLEANSVDIDGYSLHIPSDVKVGECWGEMEKTA